MTTTQAVSWYSTLDAVTVYAQGALCRRRARGTVPPDGRVRVTGLPRALDPGSLRVRALTPDGTRVTEARIEIQAEPTETAADPADALRHETERLHDAYRAAEERRDRQRGLIDEVSALRPTPPAKKRDEPHRRTPVDAWLALADFTEERLTALHTRLTTLEREYREAEHRYETAVDRLERASTATPSAHLRTEVSALLTLDTQATEAELELEYGVPGAVWVPAYRLSYRQGDGGGRLLMRASVAQRTGEDWTGVRLSLATADLRRRTDLPTLRSLRIGRRQPPPAPSGWREPPTGLTDLFTGYEAAGPRPTPPAEAVGGAAPTPAPAAYGGPPTAPPPPPFAGAAPTRPGAPRARSAAPAMAMPPGAPPLSAFTPPPPAPALPPPPSTPPHPTTPELDYTSLVLSGPQEPGDRRGRLFPATADPVADEYRRRAEAVTALPLPGHAVRPRESAGSFDHCFDAAARADIPSDGTWHTVTLTTVPVGLRTEYLTAPSAEPAVYATLLLSNATAQALLAGPVEVTVDDDHLLTAALPTLAPGAVRRLGLGPAEDIKVVRRTTLRESTTGLRNNVTVLDHRVHVELANRFPRPVTVEIHERVPVTTDPDIRIEEHADWITPPEATGPDHHAPGTRLWRLDLPPGATTALDGGYEIRIPAGKALTGGNRRS
ncbi:DUF4139 domain-containing protein [Streptomyces sp. NPDC046887]|uniref:DUF4139 domain-containing protein n=1 Tax=Streptomyces sp. NPDC046887 TaxID=3155472 RepID=UPI0033FB46CF